MPGPDSGLGGGKRLSNAAHGNDDWQPTYPFWALSIYGWTLAGFFVASLVTPILFSEASGWGAPGLDAVFLDQGASGLGYWLTWASAILLLSIPPGLSSLFLVAVADAPLARHGPYGGLFFAAWAGWLTHSLPGAMFGFLYGAIGIGGAALMLMARRRMSRPRTH